MPAGEYDIDVYADGADPDTDDPAISADGVAVPGGANVTLVAHLTEGGDPTLSAFVNDTSSIEAGQTRLIVRHTAAAPAVDVRAGERPVIEGLTNPNVEVLNLEAGTVSADVTLAGTDTVVLGPADLDLAEGTNTTVYAWGSAWSAQPVLWLRHANCRPTARPPDLVPLRTTFGASDADHLWWSVARGSLELPRQRGCRGHARRLTMCGNATEMQHGAVATVGRFGSWASLDIASPTIWATGIADTRSAPTQRFCSAIWTNAPLRMP